jgi:hypothetical protein
MEGFSAYHGGLCWEKCGIIEVVQLIRDFN